MCIQMLPNDPFIPPPPPPSNSSSLFHAFEYVILQVLWSACAPLPKLWVSCVGLYMCMRVTNRACLPGNVPECVRIYLPWPSLGTLVMFSLWSALWSANPCLTHGKGHHTFPLGHHIAFSPLPKPVLSEDLRSPNNNRIGYYIFCFISLSGTSVLILKPY